MFNRKRIHLISLDQESQINPEKQKKFFKPRIFQKSVLYLFTPETNHQNWNRYFNKLSLFMPQGQWNKRHLMKTELSHLAAYLVNPNTTQGATIKVGVKKKILTWHFIHFLFTFWIFQNFLVIKSTRWFFFFFFFFFFLNTSISWNFIFHVKTWS